MDTFELLRGTALPLTVTLEDSHGIPITKYTGAEALTAKVWPGGDRAASFNIVATWNTPSAGTIDLLITAAQSSTLEEGRYRGQLALQDPTDGLLEGYRWAIDILPDASNGPDPATYCTFNDLLDYGRSWLRTIQTDDDEAGFAEQRGRARSWLDDLILSRWPNSGNYSLGESGYGAQSWGVGSTRGPSPWLRAQIDAGGLIVRPLVVEITAKKALAFILEGQITPTGNDANQYAALGRYFHRDADGLVRTLVAEINPDASGNPAITVNLGGFSMRG